MNKLMRAIQIIRKQLISKSIKNKGGTDYIISINDFERVFDIANEDKDIKRKI